MAAYTLDTGKRSIWRRLIIGAIVAVLVLGIGSVIVVRKVYRDNLRAVSASEDVKTVTIPLGSSTHQIADILFNAGLLRSVWAFEWYVRNTNVRDDLQAGTYKMRPNQSVSELVAQLTQGKVATEYLTILPAKRLDQVKAALIRGGYSAEDVEAALRPEQYKDHPALVDKPAGASLEGYLFPETFQRTTNTKPEVVIRAALDQLQQQLTPEVRQAIVAQGLTIHQAVILASIVEQEVSTVEDKPIVAQVFLKRFREGIMLGSDVTALYGAVVDDVSLSEDPAVAAAVAIEHDSPYNTRKYTGLPPGPISNFGRSSLAAVANPAKTDYLFFVAGDPDEQGNPGKTYFASTLAEHEANVAAYCIKLCGR